MGLSMGLGWVSGGGVGVYANREYRIVGVCESCGEDPVFDLQRGYRGPGSTIALLVLNVEVNVEGFLGVGSPYTVRGGPLPTTERSWL